MEGREARWARQHPHSQPRPDAAQQCALPHQRGPGAALPGADRSAVRGHAQLAVVGFHVESTGLDGQRAAAGGWVL